MTTTTTSTSTATASSVISSAANSLLTSLGTGSGIDTASLVTSLVQADFATRNAALSTRSDALTAQISGVSTVKSAITGFATALATLSKGGTLTTQPTSANTGVLTATALPGAKLAGLSASVTVSQLAAAQGTRTITPVADRTATIGSGHFTLTLGTATYDGASMTGFNAGSTAAVSIDVTDASLDGIAAAINAKKAGVTASVVTDADGSAYLSLKGATGAAQAFTLAGSTDALKAFDVGPGAGNTSITADAQNAKLTVGGIAVERSGNTISDLIDGVKLQLTGVSAGAVAIGSTTPTDALSQAVSDVVDTYNQVLATLTAQTDPATGSLKNDSAALGLLRSLKAITLAPLLSGQSAGTPKTLAEIGVATNRDGTLRVDSTVLGKMIASHADAIEAMFATPVDGKSGVVSVLNALSTTATDKTYGLVASTTRYTAAQDGLADEKAKIATQTAAETTRLTQQFSSMNSRVTAYKSIQSFLTNQIAAWNKTTS